MLHAFFQALVITLREGFEAFLIVAISLSYLRKSGRTRLTPAVHWGIAAAIALSIIGGYLLFHAPNQELLDGPLAIVGVAWLWSRFGHRVNLALFFQVTAIFLFVFVVQLIIRGTHEMSEQGFLPYSEIIHARTESWGPDSPFGHALTYLLVIAPGIWL